MSQCTLCDKVTSDGREVKLWSGEYVGARLGLGEIKHQYARFGLHRYFICSDCRAKRRKRILRIGLAHIGFALALTIALTLAFRGVGGFEAFCLMSMIPAILSGSVFMITLRSPVYKFRKLAKQEREQADETGKARFRVFSEREYKKLEF